jgi:DeoR family transcriptional regulator, suf operon transcriptional repressor
MSNAEVEPTREKLLSILRKSGPMSVSQMAEFLGVTSIAVRHHLGVLEKDDLVQGREERHGIGRPRMLYRLSERAMDSTPSKYFMLTNMLLEKIKEQLPPEMMERFFMDIASGMAVDLKKQLEGLPLEKRLTRLVELLEKEGYVARVEAVGPEQYRLTELTCPYRKISLKHPEVCHLDESFFASALSAKVEHKSCILDGSESCTFTIANQEKEPV